MQRRNGVPVNVRPAAPIHHPSYLGRQTCKKCHQLVPRGSDRPFCLEHAEYAQRLIRQIAEMKAEGRAA